MFIRLKIVKYVEGDVMGVGKGELENKFAKGVTNYLARSYRRCKHVLARLIRRHLRPSIKVKAKNTLLFLLFREPQPKHRTVENIAPWHAVLTFYVCLLTGIIGFIVYAYTNILGLIAYYVIVALTTLEILHYKYDR